MVKRPPRKTKSAGPDVPSDRYRSILRFRTREDARKFVRQRGLDLVETRPGEEGEAVQLVFYLSQAQIKELQKDGYSPEVGQNVSELGRQRQKEVAKGDRFDSGRVVPRGMGVAKRERE